MVAALIDYSQIIGRDNNATAEVESASKALRVTPRPEELGGLGGGAYSPSATLSIGDTGALSAVSFGGPIYAFRWSAKQSIARIRRVTVSLGSPQAATGVHTYSLKIARHFRAQYTAAVDGEYGAVINSQVIAPLRTSQSDTSQPDIVNIVSTNNASAGTAEFLTGATVTLDTNPVASISVSRTAVAGVVAVKPFALWDTAEGDMPIELAYQEGFVVQLNTPSYGTAFTLSAAIFTLYDEIPLTAL